MAKRIMVVDNEDDQRNLMQQLLTRMGYQVSAAEGSEAALKMISEKKFDLVLTDLIMSGMDGAELCERIKRLRTGAKVYAFSGYMELYEPERLDRAGFDGCIEKPIDVTRLRELIEAAFSA